MLGWHIAHVVMDLVILGVILWLPNQPWYVNKLRIDPRSRQQSLTVHTRNTRVPFVDARARTNQRDTADLPRTGRQGRVARSRQGGDQLASFSNDD